MAERRRRGMTPDDDRHDEDVSRRRARRRRVDRRVRRRRDGDDDDEDDAGRGARLRPPRRSHRHQGPAEVEHAGRKSTRSKAPERASIFARLVNFVREVVAELRKVIWPTRKELITYTAVVVVFVTIMLTIVGLLDYGFARVVLWVFGNKTTPAGE